MTHAVENVNNKWVAIDETSIGGGLVFFMGWSRFESFLRGGKSELENNEKIEKIRSTSEGLYIYVKSSKCEHDMETTGSGTYCRKTDCDINWL